MSVRIVTISEGSDLVAAASDLARGPDGRGDPARAWIRAGGPLSAVELRRTGHEAQTLDGDLLLVSLEGPAQGPLVGLVSVGDALGTRLVAGEVLAALVSATTTMCILHESSSAPEAVAIMAAPAPARAPDPAPQSPTTLTSRTLVPAPLLPPAEPAREPAPARGSTPNVLSQAMPQRLVRPTAPEVDTLAPDAGDRVEHFAFGACDVIKSDGDRLHLRLGKDQRVKEIALEMLKVTELPDDGGPGKRYKLERR